MQPNQASRFAVVALQRMREQFWDTEPHYGGARGEACSGCLSPLPRMIFLATCGTAPALRIRCCHPGALSTAVPVLTFDLHLAANLPPGPLIACSDLGRAARCVRRRPGHSAHHPGQCRRDCGGTRHERVLRCAGQEVSLLLGRGAGLCRLFT